MKKKAKVSFDLEYCNNIIVAPGHGNMFHPPAWWNRTAKDRTETGTPASM